ncbi:MAG: helix-turn-helix transcriptional regulator [Trebonia sp.]
MAIARPTHHTNAGDAESAWRAYLPGTAGAAYLVAWIAGLLAWPVNLALNATSGQVAASYRAHPAEAAVQFLLVEGLAGLLLGIVLVCQLRAGSDRSGRLATGPAALGAIAVITSVSQCFIGLFAVAAATGGNVATSGTLTEAVTRLDGVKMLALVAATAWIAASGAALPRWLRVATVPLGLALIASGYAYLTLSNGLAWTPFVSLPLLLLWVAGAGITLTVAARRRDLPMLSPRTGKARDADLVAKRHNGAVANVPAARHLLRAKDLADARYFEPLAVADLAAAAGLSPAHFSRQFKAAFGESPHQYLLTRRLERAAALLCATDWSVAAICFAVGAQSVGSFTASFHRVFGMAPLAYRAAYPPAARHLRIPRCVALAYGRPQNRTFREDKAVPAP